MTVSDAQLVQESKAGRSEAYAQLVGRYERCVRAAAMRVVRHADAADDVAQEAFVLAWQQLPTLRNAAVFGPWLLKIARRCALDDLKKQRSLQYTDGLDASPAHQRNGELDEKNQTLLEMIHTLPASERQVVLLRYFGPHGVREVAAITGRGVGTVTKQLSRAHRRLKRKLRELEP